MSKPQAQEQKRVVIIAGPNGAGKTTFAREFLPGEAGCPEFINADLIAQGLSPFAPERAAIQAGRIMLNQITQYVAQCRSFAFETTLAGVGYMRHISRWQDAGFHVKLIFLSLPSADLALRRVHMRVRQGGHAIPDDVVRRRFIAGQNNFKVIYRKLVDTWILYDNTGTTPRQLESGHNQ